MIMTLIITSFGIVSFAEETEPEGIVMYRIYNPNSGEHLYTSDTNEMNYLDGNGWQYEGIGFITPTGGIEIHRLYNPNSGEHHYTKDAAEKEFLSSIGWNYEGVGWYTERVEDKCTTPVYRLYNPNATGQYEAGSHHYTTSVFERDYLSANGWNYEGISWTSMHEVTTEGVVHASCINTGYTGDAKCKTCGVVYNGKVTAINNRHNNTTYHEPIYREEIDYDTHVFTCNICGQEICRGDNSNYNDIANATVMQHLATHGYYLYGRENQWPFAVYKYNVVSMYNPTKRTPVWPGYFTCQDCGKSSYDGVNWN